MMNHHHPQDTGMQGMNSHNSHHSHQSAYQQPLYLTGHEHGLGLNVRYVILIIHSAYNISKCIVIILCTDN